MQLVYGTSKLAKIRMMRQILKHTDLEILSPEDIGAANIDVDESGNHPLSKAKIKALAWYRLLQGPVFSCDSGLYIDEVPEVLQPRVHVRMVNGRRLTDAEMTSYYASLAEKFGGRVTARYKNAICLVMGDNDLADQREDYLIHYQGFLAFFNRVLRTSE